MRTADFDFLLPEELIAQHPPPERTAARLLVLHRTSRKLEHALFTDLPRYLRRGDLLVMNNSRVIPARLWATKAAGGGRIEILLLEPAPPPEGGWWVLLRPAKRVRPGTELWLGAGPDRLTALVRSKEPDGRCHLEFPPDAQLLDHAERHGQMPLPPYISRPQAQPEDRERYQTVYAREPGSVAAPTAGLHFSTEFLARLRGEGIETSEVTLHVGLGTFSPVKADQIVDHRMHEESFMFPETVAQAILRTRHRGGRVVAVGTTSLRVLESAARVSVGRLTPGSGRTRLFIHPPAEFQVADALLTNFHLPRSTLLMLVSAFAAPGSTDGRSWVLEAYREAIANRYRFFSYGDAMLLL